MSGFLCLIGWGLIILFPVYLSFTFNRSGKQKRFCEHVKRLNGAVQQQTKEAVIVQLPGVGQPITAAFYFNGGHWFGRDTLELHIPLPVNEIDFFLCCPCSHTRNLASRWTVSKLDYIGIKKTIVATTNAEHSDPIVHQGIVSFFNQLRQNVAPKNCRVAIQENVIKIFIERYNTSLTELTMVVSLGIQLKQQITMLIDGTISLSDAKPEETSDQTCPICCCPAEAPSQCQKCNTPHCRDCWKYNNYVCGVFACGGSPRS